MDSEIDPFKYVPQTSQISQSSKDPDTAPKRQEDIPSGLLTCRQAHKGSCLGVAFDSMSNVATVGSDGFLRVWDILRSTDPIQAKIYGC
jgi:WD40 repeat protein